MCCGVEIVGRGAGGGGLHLFGRGFFEKEIHEKLD